MISLVLGQKHYFMGEDIIEKLKCRDSRAQELFDKTYSENMYYLCFRYLSSEHDCADVW